MSFLAFDRSTRCYWSLLSADLEFLYVDPVLHAHLGPQADAIVGRRLLEFVHPDEHASAQQDLRKVLQSRTLHGSVTRVRYSRLARTRARLGFNGVHLAFPDEDKVSFDDDYMACDLVINWAAEGLVLCFMHAVVDMSPQDNDEVHRTHWTNWCGTPRMSVEHGNQLYHALFHLGTHGSPPPTRVFQILHNTTARPALFSWPVEGYIPADYGRLANDVHIGGANGSDAKTSCTRRYKAQQVLDCADGSIRDVESIFIPHGEIIFACHKATPRRTRTHPSPYPLYPTPAPAPAPAPAPTHAPTHAPAATSSTSTTSTASTPASVPFYEHTPYYPPLPVPSQADPYPPPPAHAYSHYPPSPPRDTSDWPLPYIPTQPLLDEVPPPRQQRLGRLSPDDASAASPGPSTSTRDAYPSGGRAGGNPPVGVSRCAACKSTSSPEWRKGPSGRKDLCNACGLRYSRARAKKEGIVVQRRRKDAAKPPGPPGPQGPQGPQGHTHGSPSRRRVYVHGGGGGGGEFVLDEHQQHHLGAGSAEGSTPSPSPPLEYPQTQPPQHAGSSSGLYSYPAPHALYPHPYSHGNGFLASVSTPTHTHTHAHTHTPGPAPGLGITSASSYERVSATMPARPHALDTHAHVHS